MRNRSYPSAIRALGRTPEMHEFMFREAQRAAVHALRLAPSRLGYYRRAIFARRGANGVVGARASASFGSDDFKAWWVEYGTAKGMAGHYVLTRTVRERGYRVGWVNRRGR
jgi:hypothetical protein